MKILYYKHSVFIHGVGYMAKSCPKSHTAVDKEYIVDAYAIYSPLPKYKIIKNCWWDVAQLVSAVVL